MNKEDLALEELQKIMQKLDALEKRQNEISTNVNRLVAWVEKVVEMSQQSAGKMEGEPLEKKGLYG